MLRKATFAVLLCAVAAIIALLCLGGSAADARPAADNHASAPMSEENRGERSVRLFAVAAREEISALSVRSEDRRFDFLCGDGGVSVNGQQADDESFFTLLEQILSLPVIPCEPFSPEGEAVLTLTLTADGLNHTACFYGTGDRELARVISDAPDEPLYGQVKSWRIGTLLMACDGTRIQDESGNETPAR